MRSEKGDGLKSQKGLPDPLTDPLIAKVKNVTLSPRDLGSG